MFVHHVLSHSKKGCGISYQCPGNDKSKLKKLAGWAIIGSRLRMECFQKKYFAAICQFNERFMLKSKSFNGTLENKSKGFKNGIFLRLMLSRHFLYLKGPANFFRFSNWKEYIKKQNLTQNFDFFMTITICTVKYSKLSMNKQKFLSNYLLLRSNCIHITIYLYDFRQHLCISLTLPLWWLRILDLSPGAILFPSLYSNFSWAWEPIPRRILDTPF